MIIKIENVLPYWHLSRQRFFFAYEQRSLWKPARCFESRSATSFLAEKAASDSLFSNLEGGDADVWLRKVTIQPLPKATDYWPHHNFDED